MFDTMRHMNDAKNTPFVLSIIRGLPGSGKSTFARKHFPGILHLENDMLRMKSGRYRFDQDEQNDRMSKIADMTGLALETGADVVVSNVFATLKSIRFYVFKGYENGARVDIYRMAGDNFGNVHSVPRGIFESMKTHFVDIPEGPLCGSVEPDDPSHDWMWPKEKFVYPQADGTYRILEEKI